MGFARFLVFLALIGFGVHWWNGRDSASATLAEKSSPSGFVQAAMPDGAPPNTIVILAPLNCPSDGAQRADSLAGQLEGQQIPVLRSSHYSANSDGFNPERMAGLNRAVSVLEGEVPAVFVNGMAKSNPTFEEVIAEYQRAR
ncbi:MAG: hypothetical protein OEV23_02830 [Gallionella sp.]|nr:hypothetical protein [Gallionella sp.]